MCGCGESPTSASRPTPTTTETEPKVPSTRLSLLALMLWKRLLSLGGVPIFRLRTYAVVNVLRSHLGIYQHSLTMISVLPRILVSSSFSDILGIREHKIINKIRWRVFLSLLRCRPFVLLMPPGGKRGYLPPISCKPVSGKILISRF